MGKIIKFLIYGVFLVILYVMLGSLYNRKNDVGTAGERASKYVVKLPSVLKYTYLILFAVGTLMFVTFLFFRIKGNASVTDGHIVLALIAMTIGLLVMIFASGWRVIVNENQLEIYRYFREKKVLQISELDYVEIGKKYQMILYQNGEKITTVNFLADNYDNLKEAFEQNGKLRQEK